MLKNKDSATLFKIREKVVTALNVAIRKKFPENEMIVLRKYKLTRTDYCMKLVDSVTNAVFGINLEIVSEKEATKLADTPTGQGHNSQDVYPMDPKGHALIDEYLSLKEASREERSNKSRDYRSFLSACRYVEDAHEVVPFPKEMQTLLFSGGAIILINKEIIAAIRSEFVN